MGTHYEFGKTGKRESVKRRNYSSNNKLKSYAVKKYSSVNRLGRQAATGGG